MTLHPGRIGAASLTRVFAIYAVSVPFAWAVTPDPLPWELVATALSLVLVPVMRLGAWWLAINAVFLPALIAALELNLAPGWSLAALALLALLYGRIWTSQVPLFFSSRDAQIALAKLLPDRPITFLDAGCGDARVLTRLASARPESRFHGIEHALGPWLAARMRCRDREQQCHVFRGDLWGRTLAQYDVVYAFLSPAVMQRLWDKARQEMRPGSLLVSAFGVPNVKPDEQFEVGDVLRTQLHVWRMGLEGQRP
jgi:SAM-dependent methyltransferase